MWNSQANRAIALITVLATSRVLLAGAPISAEIPAASNSLPHPDLLDLFGGQASRPAPAAEPGVLSSIEEPRRGENQEIRRPAPAVTPDASATGAELKPIRRQAASSSGWRPQDALPLLAVVALIVGGAIALKRFLPARSALARLTGAGVLDVVARTPLSPRQSLVLVKMGGRLILLGVTPDRISSLSVVDDPEQVAAVVGEVASRRPNSIAQSFAHSFSEQAGAYESEDDAADQEAAARGHVRGLLDKVRQMSGKRDVA